MKLNKIFLPIIILLLTSQLSLTDIKDSLHGSPSKITKWLEENIVPTRDKVSYAQTAQETFDKRQGDCEDISILAQYLIGNVYETYLIVWEGKFKEDSKYYKEHKEKICHCVCVVKIHDEMWGCIDVDRYVHGKATLVGIILEDCDLRKIKVERAYFVRRDDKGRIRVTGKIDLNDFWKVY